MDFHIALIRRKKPAASEPEIQLFRRYLARSERYAPCVARDFATEEALFDHLARSVGRTRPFLVILDSLGRQLSSEDLADTILSVKERSVQQVVFAVGPASGWSDAARQRADVKLSLGRITLPHDLAAVVIAEQLYRVLTIHAGHPYHLGH